MHIIIGIVIVAALLIYAPRVAFVAAGLAVAGAVLVAIFLVWGPLPEPVPVNMNCDHHWRIGCPISTPVAAAAPRYRSTPVMLKEWWETAPGDKCDAEPTATGGFRCFRLCKPGAVCD
jgi:hypothetical protein